MALLLTRAIGSIFTIIERVQFFRDLFANDAQNSITVEELTRAFRGELAAFFALVEITNLQTIHAQFYGVWLPSVANRTTITSDDVNSPSGSLHHVFNSMLASIETVFRTLNRLEAVYRQHSDTFHVDRVVQSQIMFIEMYGLLLHIHSTCATLRQIQVGASTLDDPRLLPDTLAALLYVDHMERTLIWADYTGRNRRLVLLKEVRFDHHGWHNGVPAWRFWYEDTYQHLSDTPVHNQSHVASPPAFYQRTIPMTGPPQPTEPARRHVENTRTNRYNQIRMRLDNIVSSDGGNIRRMMPSLRIQLRERERHQRNTRTQNPRGSPAQFQVRTVRLGYPGVKDEEDIVGKRVGAADDSPDLGMIIIPRNVDEYLALSEYLCTLTSGEDPVNTDNGEVALECLSCHRVMTSLEYAAQRQGNTKVEDARNHYPYVIVTSHVTSRCKKQGGESRQLSGAGRGMLLQ